MRLLAPDGTRRRDLLRALASRLVGARRGEGPAVPAAVRRYRHLYAATRPSAVDLEARRAGLGRLAVHPTVSVVVVDDDPATLASLDAQCYDRIERVVAPGGEGATASRSSRCNAAVDAATGEFVFVLRAGDRLEPHAVFDLVGAVQDGSDAAYGDEDRLDAEGQHVGAHLKPARFGHETLFSYDVVGAPLLVRRELFVELGGFDERAEPVEAHDLALRLAERTGAIAHVSDVLVSRRLDADPDPADATAATIPVVRAAFERIGRTATVTPGDVLPGVRFTIAPPDPAPSVAIVIPTRDRLDLLAACVESVELRTTYPNYTIVLLDNDSKEPETLAWLDASPHEVVRCPGPFNYSRIVNRGVAHTTADFVVTLNNDTTIATPEWLDHLVGLCSLPHVGTVGVKLAFPDGRLQHEGVGIIPMPVHLSRDSNYEEPDRWLCSTRDAVAVTGACQIVRREVWDELGGLDERLAVAFNDIDFGMRANVAGWRAVYTPEVVLGHRESASRGNLHPPADEALLIARWDLLGTYVDPSMPPAMRYDELGEVSLREWRAAVAVAAAGA
jgi:GT2 family glycosyltransferase